MKPVDLIEVFKRSVGRFALVATYDFDPVFFERRLLHTQGFGSAERIVVLMDSRRYQQLLNDGVSASGFNRRYLVLPIRAQGVFHPKLYLVLGEKRATAVVGSCNCTSAGIAYNMELCSVFSTDLRKADEGSGSLQLIRRTYEAWKAFLPEKNEVTDVLGARILPLIEEDFGWLHRDATFDSAQTDVQLFSSSNGPIWSRVVEELSGREVLKITVLSPFFDSDIRLVSRIRRLWPEANLTIVAQPKYSNLPGGQLNQLSGSDETLRLLAASPPSGRRLHAKALVFETNAGVFWLTGSANATAAALDGLNAEASIWLRSEEGPETILDTDQISTRVVDPSEFESGPDENTVDDDVDSTSEALSLQSAILKEDGILEARAVVSEEVKDLKLRVRNFNEELPVLSIAYPGRDPGAFKQLLTDDQVSQIHGTAICELKGHCDGLEVVSNRVSLVQLNQLLRERGNSGGARNPRRKITETGENLIEFIDQLGSRREIVEFLYHVNIRFDDGQFPGGRPSAHFWRPRDPFEPDVPKGWLSGADGVSDEDMRTAIWDFVERHQRDKLSKHVRRGNLNGLSNFLDIFRTLNRLLLASNARATKSGVPVIPHPFLTTGMLKNLELLLGPFKANGDEIGYVDAIKQNLGNDIEILRERLKKERVGDMARAAVEALTEVRRIALRKTGDDAWSLQRIQWVDSWIKANGLDQPSREDIAIALQEYGSGKLAA